MKVVAVLARERGLRTFVVDDDKLLEVEVTVRMRDEDC